MSQRGTASPVFSSYLASLRQQRALAREEERSLAVAYRQGDRGAGDRLIEAHLALVVHVAKRYRGYGIPISELVGEGNIGLCEALRRFDAERGIRFATYARHWIRAFVLAHALRQSRMVGIGVGTQQSKLFFGLMRARARLTAELGEGDPKMAERLAALFGVSEARVSDALARLTAHDSSLDAPVGEGGHPSTHLDLLRDPSPSPAELMEQSETAERLRDVVCEVWSQLDERERVIVQHRLLPGDRDPRSLAELGRRLGVTRERVRQLEVVVRHKLQRALSARLPDFAPHASPGL